MMTLGWLRAIWTRRPGRQLATAGGVALAVGLLASLGVFLASSKATMTSRSIARVAVDWQVEAQPGRDPAEVDALTRAFPGVQAASSVDFAGVSAFEATTGGTTQTTGEGVAVGWSDDYLRLFPATARSLVGSANGVLLAQQTAANLHASPGDSVSIARAGLPAATVVVDGVIDMPQADSFFQRVGAPAGAQLTAPPDNVIVMPIATWHRLFDPLAIARPDLVHHQVHVRLDHRLPSDPASAYTRVTGRARNLEARLTGGGSVGDNLGAALASARTDALYAQMLFLFLGLPGAAVAGLLTAAVAASGADRRRREYALLRAAVLAHTRCHAWASPKDCRSASSERPWASCSVPGSPARHWEGCTSSGHQPRPCCGCSARCCSVSAPRCWRSRCPRDAMRARSPCRRRDAPWSVR